MSFRVLTIDAWGNAEDGYVWNDLHHILTLEHDVCEETAIDALVGAGLLNAQARFNCYAEDDGINFVVCDCSTYEPLYAIEYDSGV